MAFDQPPSSCQALLVGYEIAFDVTSGHQHSHSDESLAARARSSRSWHDYERGKISAKQCEENLTTVYGHNVARQVTSQSMHNPDCVSLDVLLTLQKIRAVAPVRCFLTANLSPDAANVLKRSKHIQDVFDGLLTSSELGARREDLLFYQKVPATIKCNSGEILCLEKDPENVARARVAGLRAVLVNHHDGTSLYRDIVNSIHPPVTRAVAYLEANAKKLITTCRGPTGISACRENFSQLLVLENTGDESLVELGPFEGWWNFFQGEQKITTTTFPNDLDTTAVAMTLLTHELPMTGFQQILKDSLLYRSADDLPLIYQDHDRPRLDLVAMVHIYTLYYTHGYAQQLRSTWEYIWQVLLTRGYLHGSRYYVPGEYFLYAFSRLLLWQHRLRLPLTQPSDDECNAVEQIHQTFTARCQEQLGYGASNALQRSLRIIVCIVADVPRSYLYADVARLCELQEPDGSWSWCPLYRAPSADIELGSSGLTTAFALKALRLYHG